MNAGPQQMIIGDEPLAAFRQGLTGPYAMTLLDEAKGRLLIQLTVGVGKTQFLVDSTIHAVTADLFDLVVGLVPRWDILNELRERLPADLRLVLVKPRPSRRCGELDECWKQYEQRGCGLLGRKKLCGLCPRANNCSWPAQYGARLRGARLILATQQHLVLNPHFIHHLGQQANARRVLSLVDESNLLLSSTERMISAADLARFSQVQKTLLDRAEQPRKQQVEWLELSRMIAGASTIDLRDGTWKFPWVDATWAVHVQEQGWALYGQQFRFIGHDLQHFAQSDVSSRERLTGGDIRFASLPYLGSKFIIFSGSIARPLARYRLDPNHERPTLMSPFEHYCFSHPGTKWFNLNNMEGAARYFRRNATRLMDFFAVKIARNITEGKRTLLVSRKKFVPLCRNLLRERLRKLGVEPVRIVCRGWTKHNLSDPRTVPLISYGIAGLNRFEGFHAAYCLNSFYIPPAAVSQTVQELEASTERYAVTIATTGRPARRSARVELPDAWETIIPVVAEQVLVQKEADVVVQAVGRVRPFTREREVITFHAGELPGVHYTREFLTLAQARSHFGILPSSQVAMQVRADEVLRLMALGKTKKQIAEALGVSLSTVKRDLRRQGGHPT